LGAHIDRALPVDAPAVLRLLERNRLPLEGVTDWMTTTLVAREDGQIIGSAALEIDPDGALLRSVAVAPEAQRQGVGHELTAAAIHLADTLNAPALYLLTTTAQRFFPRFGFERIAGTDVPAAVQASIECTSACPSTATVMRKTL
jgi:amino-acid N-acetyltransferase